ncbi:MAG: beta-xylosidase [Acidobacteria bacterium RIFCSPLOWO2_02_FULL_67_36]|nr:MAG: beta-xylosidase [Acidobacteria bacterium RIFCSPLOWO2_02_FULL_67_36]
MRRVVALLLFAAVGVSVPLVPRISAKIPREDPVAIRVDADRRQGPLTPIWAFFGYDEPNYTYMKDGRKLLSELSALSPVPVFVRTHNLLTSGDGTPALKWGSTNAYTEDAAGRPKYDWAIVDRIFDTFIQRKMKPLVEIGFMPEALSTRPHPYKHDWAPGLDYGRIYTGWTYPPTDYGKWGELVYQWVRHSVARYGRAEVESWYWEVWNEPDIGYWRGTPEEFQRLYDYAADGLKRALPTARIGGPHVTGPNGARTQQILRNFIEHCLRGTNYATGRTGAPLDYVGFHAKGAPRVIDGHVRMGIANQLQAISNGFRIVASFPELRDTPIIIGESDPEGCAACSVRTNPENGYRNGTMYSSYTAAQIARTYELADLHDVNLRGSVTWAFEFEDQPPFAGLRDLATNGIDKPVLNVFRMLGMMRGDRVAVGSSSADSVEVIRDRGVRARPDIYAIAARSGGDLTALVWNYHDDDLPAPSAEVVLTLSGLKDGRALLSHYRIDAEHSNAYAAWQRMGSPDHPTAKQRVALERAGHLQRLVDPERVTVAQGELRVSFALPRQAVSLIKVEGRVP